MPQLVMALQCSMVNAMTLGVPRGGPRSAMKASRDGCTLPASSVARLCRTTGRPFQCHGVRKRVNAFAQYRLLQRRARPTLTAIGRDHDPGDAAGTGECDTGDLVEGRTASGSGPATAA